MLTTADPLLDLLRNLPDPMTEPALRDWIDLLRRTDREAVKDLPHSDDIGECLRDLAKEGLAECKNGEWSAIPQVAEVPKNPQKLQRELFA